MILRVFTWLLGLTCLLAGVGLTWAQSDEIEFDTSMAQARVFLKKGWYRDAVKELRRAISTSQGKENFEAHLLLSQACFKEFDIGCAVKVSQTAMSLAKTPDESNNAQGMSDYLSKNFGKVEFQAGPNELSEGYLRLKPVEPILDKEAKLYFTEKVAPLQSQKRSLPWLIYLPATAYDLHGHEFVVEGGKEIKVNAGFTAENSKPPKEPELRPEDFEGIGLAVALRFGGSYTKLNGLPDTEPFTGLVAELSGQYRLSHRLGVGAFVKSNHQSLQVGSYDSSSYPISYGALLSLYQPVGAKFQLIPSLGYSLGAGPVMIFNDCSVQAAGGGEQVTCSDPANSGTVTAVLPSRSHGPLGRIELMHEKRKRTRIVRWGAGLQAIYGLAAQVKQGVGTYVEDGGTINYNVASDFAAHPVRLEFLAGVNMTF